VERLFRDAKEAHCHLIVFPEYLPLSLLGAIMPPATTASTLSDAAVGSLLRSLGLPLYAHWQRWMSHLSRKYGMVAIAGSGLTLHEGQLINAAVGYYPDGSPALWQPKWHPLAEELRWGVSPGPVRPPDILEPWHLATLVCNDASYFESFRIVESQGARIVAVPIADPDPRYTEGKARRGCFSRVQDVPMVGVVAASTGQLFGMRLTGKAGIYVPADLTPDGSGVLAESRHPVGEGIVSAVVSLKEIDEYQKQRRAQVPSVPADFLQALYQFKEDG
jgi:predicted amidohydrolase